MRHGSEQDEDVPDGMEVGAAIVGKEIRAGSVEEAFAEEQDDGEL